MIGKVFAMTEGAACSEGWIFVGLFPFHLQFISLFCLLNVVAPPPQFVSPGEAPPGSRQGAQEGGEGQRREERVEGEVEQAFHPIIAQAF